MTMEKYRQLDPEWESLPDEVIEKIIETATRVDSLIESEAQDIVHSLNVFLDYEKVIGNTVRLTSDEVLVSEEQLSSNGISLDPVFDGELLKRRRFVGRFGGVDLYPNFNRSGMQLVFRMNYEENEKNYSVIAPQRGARLEVESVDPDTEVEEAFVYLFETDDAPYLKAVKKLEKAYHDSEIDSALRLREIGTYAARMMRRPAHYAVSERAHALHTILDSLFDEVDYFVSGYAADDSVNEGTADSVLTVDRAKTNAQGFIEEVIYISDFTVEISKDGKMQVIPEDDFQPAIRLVFDDGTKSVYPLRQISYITEAHGPLSCYEFNTMMRENL